MSANELTPEQYEMLYGEPPPAAVEQTALEQTIGQQTVGQLAIEKAPVEASPEKSSRWWPSLLLVAVVAIAVIVATSILRDDEAPLATTENTVTEVAEESVIVSEGLDTVPETSTTAVDAAASDTPTTVAEAEEDEIADAAVAEPATAPNGDAPATTEAPTTDADTTTTTSQATTTASTTTEAPATDDDTITITCLDGSEIRGVVADAYASLDEAQQQLCGSPESEQWRLDLTVAGFGDDTELYSSEQIDAFSVRTCELIEDDAGAAWLAAATELNLPGADGLPPPVQQVFGEASISAYCP